MSDDKPPLSIYLYRLAVTAGLLTVLFFGFDIFTLRGDYDVDFSRLAWICLGAAACFYVASLIAQTWDR